MVQIRVLFPKSLATACTLILVLALGTQARADATIYRQMLRSTGWVVAKQSKKKNSSGTCWILDVRRRLVVTNQHVVGKRRHVKVFFPRYRKGKVIKAARHYVQKGGKISGRVLATDSKRDLALIRLKKIPRGLRAFTLASERPAEGEMLYSVGNSSVRGNVKTGKLWRFISSKARQVVFGKFEQAKLTVEACVLHTYSRFDHGDSGGPLVNARNQLVGVVDAYSTTNRDIGYSIDVTEVQEFVSQALQGRPEAVQGRLVGGSWKAVLAQNGKETFFRVTFQPDGTLELIGAIICQGRYTFANNLLRLEIAAAKVRVKGSIKWVSDSRFTVEFGKEKFDFQRR
jgi:S1-C subfamily serine protease